MIQSYKIVILAALIISSVTAGCSAPHMIYHAYSPRPIYPELRDTDKYPLVDSLQPVLKWKDIREEDQIYDMCIWLPSSDGTNRTFSPDSTMWTQVTKGTTSWGTPIYCVENLYVNYHKVWKQLLPDTQYNWSVRLRKGKEAFRWGGFSQTQQILTTTNYRRNIPYGFTTPINSTPNATASDTNTPNPDTTVAIPGNP
jgi:hypothetical protein